MNQIFHAGALAAALFTTLASGGAALAAADQKVSKTYPVEPGTTRVVVEGVVDLRLRQGPVPSLVVSGAWGPMSMVTTGQEGNVLRIGAEPADAGSPSRDGHVRAELTLPALYEVASNSVGWTDISGFSGDELMLNMEGAGSMKVNSSYSAVHARLGGVGSMNIQGAYSEGIELALGGAGFVTLGGRTSSLKASLGGLGGLDAQRLQADSVQLHLNGLGSATVTALESVTLKVSGMGAVTVYGKPPLRDVRVDGLGKVNWK